MTKDSPRTSPVEKTVLDNLITAILLFDSDLCLEAQAAGWTYERLINTIVNLAALRQGVREGSLEKIASGEFD